MNKPELTDEKARIQIMQYLLEKEDYKRHHAYTETFHYMNALAKEGYIHAFAKLGSHYELEISCVKDKNEV